MAEIEVSPGEKFTLSLKLKWKKADVSRLADPQNYSHWKVDAMSNPDYPTSVWCEGIDPYNPTKITQDDQVVTATITVNPNHKVGGTFKVELKYVWAGYTFMEGSKVPQSQRFPIGNIKIRKTQ